MPPDSSSLGLKRVEMIANRVLIRAILIFIFTTLTSSCTTCPPTLLSYNDLGVAKFLTDDRSITVVLNSYSSSNIYQINIDGTNLRKISENLPIGYDHAFSPDGSLVSFRRTSDDQGDICVVRMDGTGSTCLTSGPENDFEPVFSSDGSKIYFLRANAFRKYSPMAWPGWHDVDVYSISIDGLDLNRVTFTNAYRMSGLSISPNGDYLIVMKASQSNPILVIPISDPTNAKTYRPDLSKYSEKSLLFWKKKIDYNEIRNPRLSPDGNHILFSWPLYNGLFLMDVKTNITKRIWTWEPEDAICDQFGGYTKDGTPLSEVRQMGHMYPSFSPNGRHVVFSTSGAPRRSGWESKIWVINIDGSDLRSVEMK